MLCSCGVDWCRSGVGAVLEWGWCGIEMIAGVVCVL